MESERSDMGYRRWKDNEMKFMNLQPLMGISDGFRNGDIPEWLLVEVFVRLPPKLVCRFKLVSKQWLSIISDPSFVRTYVSRASLLSQPWTFISHLMHHKGYKDSHFPEYMLLEDVYSQLVKPSYCVLPLPCTQQSHDGEEYMIEGVSNGLVLYSLSVLDNDLPLRITHSYYICNPVTHLWIALPRVTCCFPVKGCAFLTHVEDALLKSYEVVLLETTGSKFLRFEVFFSATGQWNRFTLCNDPEKRISYSHVSRREAIAINGVLHWVVSGVGIIAYDPYEGPEQMRVIAFPDDITYPQQNADNSLCGEYNGKLRYLELSIESISGKHLLGFKLWVLNDYIFGDWSLHHNISHMDIQYDANLSLNAWFLTPISFHPFDLDVVYLGWDDALVSYNIKTKELEVQQKCCRQNEITPKQKPEWWLTLLLVIPSHTISSCFSYGGAEG